MTISKRICLRSQGYVSLTHLMGQNWPVHVRSDGRVVFVAKPNSNLRVAKAAARAFASHHGLTCKFRSLVVFERGIVCLAQGNHEWFPLLMLNELFLLGVCSRGGGGNKEEAKVGASMIAQRQGTDFLPGIVVYLDQPTVEAALHGRQIVVRGD